jgi:hypothetical protein
VSFEHNVSSWQSLLGGADEREARSTSRRKRDSANEPAREREPRLGVANGNPRRKRQREEQSPHSEAVWTRRRVQLSYAITATMNRTVTPKNDGGPTRAIGMVIIGDPFFSELAYDARYQDLLARLDLPPANGR